MIRRILVELFKMLAMLRDLHEADIELRNLIETAMAGVVENRVQLKTLTARIQELEAKMTPN